MIKTLKHQLQRNQTLTIRWLIYVSLSILIVDFIYKTAFGISRQNRGECLLYQQTPSYVFAVYENFIELFLVILCGIFIAVILEKQFLRYKRFYPKNQWSAFVYASLIPVCSCSAIPLIETMKQKMNFKTVITFVVAAPLLNPYIIILSFSVLGANYGISRIVSALMLSFTSGWILNFFYYRFGLTATDSFVVNCQKTDCSVYEQDIYLKTWQITRILLPFISIAGLLSFLTDYLQLENLLNSLSIENKSLEILLAIAIGIPVYLCNGTDVVFLKPLLLYSGISLGSGIAFSLTSSAICFSSILMLTKFIGRKMTIILIINLIIVTFFIGLIINVFLT